MTPEPETSVNPPTLDGVRGWMLILCIYLIFIYPPTNAFLIVDNQFGYEDVVIFLAWLGVAVSALGGVLLYRKHKLGFFLAAALFGIRALIQGRILLSMFERPHRVLPIQWVMAIGSLIVSIAWLTYIMQSKRIATTLKLNSPAKPQ